MASPLVVNVAELLRDPAARKAVRAPARADEVDVTDRRIAPDAVIDVDVVLESSLDGIVARGTVATEWHDSCRRCARLIGGTVRLAIEELFQQRPSHDDASPIVGEQLDLGPVVRDVVLLDTPVAALCREACAGLCPTCGADLNDGPCGCESLHADDRWGVLDHLRDQLG